jgi:hypothetical protein
LRSRDFSGRQRNQFAEAQPEDRNCEECVIVIVIVIVIVLVLMTVT